jgi:hypothetical protein
VLAGDFDEFGVEVGVEDLFFVVAGESDDAAEGVGDEAAAPELDARLRSVVAGAAEFDGGGVAVGGDGFEFDVAVLVAYAVDCADEDSVGDGVGALGGLPGFILGGAELFFFGGVPADGGGEEEDLGAFEGGEAGAFGIPLVPADEGADGAGGGAGGFEAEVAGGEVELFVVERVVGDVHLAVEVGDGAIFFDGDGGVVVQARRSPFEKAGYEDDAGLAADAGEDIGGGAWDGLGEIEEGVFFALAEVLGTEELREADEGGSLAGGFVDALGGLVEVDAGVRIAGHLNEGDTLGRCFSHGSPFYLIGWWADDGHQGWNVAAT